MKSMTKILLVEDDSNLREIYAASLEAEEYETITASDGEEALAVAVREKPDLLILDVMMPKISGFDVLDILRSTPEVKNAKIIMMTALSQQSDKERGERLGADRYLIKSQITIEDMVAVVAEVLAEPAKGVEEVKPAEPAEEDIFIPNLPIDAAVAEAGQQPNTENYVDRTQQITSQAPAPAMPLVDEPAPQVQQHSATMQPVTQAAPTDDNQQQNGSSQQQPPLATPPVAQSSYVSSDDDSDSALADNGNVVTDQPINSATQDFDDNMSDEQAMIAEAEQQNNQSS
jgi:DNA-binding response OmpR family regulator